MDVRLRSRSIGLLLTLLAICLPALAEEAATDTTDPAQGMDPHSAMEDTQGPATQSLPLEDLQMFADVFNQIRQAMSSPCPTASYLNSLFRECCLGLIPTQFF